MPMIDLPEQHQLFREAVAAFAAREIAPRVAEEREDAPFPRELFPALGRLGYLGAPFPAELGGGALGALGAAVLAEELGAVSPGVCLGIYVHVALALGAVAQLGDAAQRRRYFEPGLRGEAVGAWAYAEPDAGADVTAVRTSARKIPDGYALNGSKLYITNGSFADFFVVVARTAAGAGLEGISLFIVDRGAPGFAPPRRLRTLGMHPAETAELVFEDCRIPADALLGPLDGGLKEVLKALTLGRIMAAAFANGLSRRALSDVTAHLRSRRQFDRPLAAFQVPRHALADAATELEAARLLTLNAACLADAGRPHIREASMAKLFATRACTRLCERALHFAGAQGYMRESPFQRHYRDCKVLEFGEGTTEIQKDVIARQMGL